MEPNEEDSNNGKKKKLNEDFVTFMKKRSEHDAPQYTTRLKTYVTLQEKRSRANNARRNYEERLTDQNSTARRERRERHERRERRREAEMRERNENSTRHKSPRGGDKALQSPGANPDENIVLARGCCGLGREQRDSGSRDGHMTRRHSRGRSMSVSGSEAEPSDRCGRRRRRRRRRCKRRRRRRRRRRSCRRRRRRRRRKSCCPRRRRRRKSCCPRRRRRRSRSCRRRRRRRRRRC